MSSITYKKYRSMGLCGFCGAEIAEGKALCDRCLEKTRKKKKQNRDFVRSIGICTCCGTRKARAGKILCEECSEKAKAYKQANHDKIMEQERENYNARKERRNKQGICVKCGKRPSVQGKQYCAVCASKHSERSRERRIKLGLMASDLPRSEWVANGLCYICGTKLTDTTHKLCETCRARSANNLRGAKPNRDHWKNDNKMLKNHIDISRR